ncbi:MAG: Tetraspanin-18 [Marteilia pararefringens]
MLLIILSIVALTDKETFFKMLDIAIDNKSLMVAVSNWIGKYAFGILFFTSLLFIISLIGCVGSLLKNGSGLLMIYIIVLMFLILLSLVFVILITVKNETAMNKFFKFLTETLKYDYDGTHLAKSPPKSLLIDFLQIQFECCSIEELDEFSSAENWKLRKYGGYEGLYYPASCCVTEKSKKKTFVKPFNILDEDKCLKHSQNLADDETGTSYEIKDTRDFSNAFKPCKPELLNFLYTNSHFIWSIILGIICLEYTSLIFAILIRNSKLHD